MEHALDDEELRRYGRHLGLPGVGLTGQRRINQSRVLVIGAGGLGSPTLLYLAAAGVGTLGIVDPDVVELSNLQRQVIHTEATCGDSKVDSAREAIGALNSRVRVESIDDWITSDNAQDLVKDYDLVIDGSDNFVTRHVVGDACYLAGISCIWGSVFQFQGQVSVFPKGGQPCYRCLYPEAPPTELAPSCAEGGVFGATCGTVASVQVGEALKILMGIGSPLVGRVWTHDGLQGVSRTLKFPARDDCRLCGSNPTITTVEEIEQVCGVSVDVPTIKPKELESLLKSREINCDPFDLVDVRDPYEWAIRTIEGAERIPLEEFLSSLPQRDPNRRMVIYCKTGARSERAAQAAIIQGFDSLNLEGGILSWAQVVDGNPIHY